jgi:microcystin degradation protein MlrC
VASDNPQLADQEMYRFIGVEPTAEKILVNKSSVHFRADFTPIAEEILVAKAPGPMLADPSEYRWQRLTPGIRLKRQTVQAHTFVSCSGNSAESCAAPVGDIRKDASR